MSRQKPKRVARETTVSPPTPGAVKELLLEHEVSELCRMSRAYKLEQAERFPRRKKYGFRRVAWLAREIDEWITIGAEAWATIHGTSAAA